MTLFGVTSSSNTAHALDVLLAKGPGHTAAKKFLTINLEGPFGPGDSFVHLKRKRVITHDGLWISPGEGHLKKLLELAGLNLQSTGRQVPQVKDLTAIESVELDAEEHSLYRSITGILMYNVLGNRST